MHFENIEQIKLLEGPTPLQKIPRFGASIHLPNLYIKRDDHMLLGLGGNKLRNLEFWLAEALKQKADLLVAAGGLQSNQCRLTAAAAAKVGLQCLLIHNDDRPAVPEGNGFLNYLLGAETIYLGKISEEERGRQVETILDRLKKQGRRPYLIGDAGLGALGYANAAEELAQQSLLLERPINQVVIVGAMCVTAGGFLYGTSLCNAPYHVHVISVEYPLEIMKSAIEQVWQKAINRTGKIPELHYTAFSTFYDAYLGEDYAIPTEEAWKAMKSLAQLEGIFLEQVYSAKTMAGLIDLRRRGLLQEEDCVCIIHTGGYGALFTQNKLLINTFQR